MKCPTCHSKLNPGTASIQRSDLGAIGDLIFFGRAGDTAHYLYFQPTGEAEAICIDHTHKALGCLKCHTLVIAPPGRQRPGTQDEAIECMSCGKTMPAGASKCAGCGWTWEDADAEGETEA